MLRFYTLLFVAVLLGSALLRLFPQTNSYYQAPMSPLADMQPPKDQRQLEETIPVYAIERTQSDFPCFQTAMRTFVLQHSENNAKKLQQIQKGQKLCYNFPQILANTTHYITLKAIQAQWVRITIMGDSLLLSGYIPLQSLRHWQQIQASSLAEHVSESKLLFYAPKIISRDSKSVDGDFSMPLLLQLASDSLLAQDHESVRAWLALAQQHDSQEIAIYELYAKLLLLEGRTSEGNALLKEIKRE